MYLKRVDVRVGAAPWVLKIEYADNQFLFLRYQVFNEALDFMNAVSDWFGKDVRMCLMSQMEFVAQAFERNHEEWLDMVEDVENED